MITIETARSISSALEDPGSAERPKRCSAIRNVLSDKDERFYVETYCAALDFSELGALIELAAQHRTTFRVAVRVERGPAEGLVGIFGR